MKRFWEIVYDDSMHTMEVIGSSTDDTLMTNNIAEMQRVGMKVHCQTANIDTPKERINLIGYSIENNLYSRLMFEYERLTNKNLKLW